MRAVIRQGARDNIWPVKNMLPVFQKVLFDWLHTHTHTRLTALCPGLPGWAGTRKVKPIWILLKQETVSGSGISWAICKSAPRSRQITMPTSHHSSFLQAGCPSCRPTNSVKALKALTAQNKIRSGVPHSLNDYIPAGMVVVWPMVLSTWLELRWETVCRHVACQLVTSHHSHHSHLPLAGWEMSARWGRRNSGQRSASGKVTVGLASHWLWIPDSATHNDLTNIIVTENSDTTQSLTLFLWVTWAYINLS